MNEGFDFLAYLASSFAGLCFFALWSHNLASMTKSKHDAQVRRNRNAYAPFNYSYEERSVDGMTCCIERTNTGDEDFHRIRTFDSRGQLQTDYRPRLLVSLLVPNVLCWLFLNSANLAPIRVDYGGRSVLAKPASDALREACDWRERIARDDEIEPRAPDGYLRDYWPNGAPRSVEPLVGGRRHGYAHYTFANGALYGDIPWRDGRKHGVFTLYREDGSKEGTMSDRDGVPYGLNEWFAPDGRRTAAEVYLDDRHFAPPERCATAGP